MNVGGSVLRKLLQGWYDTTVAQVCSGLSASTRCCSWHECRGPCTEHDPLGLGETLSGWIAKTVAPCLVSLVAAVTTPGGCPLRTTAYLQGRIRKEPEANADGQLLESVHQDAVKDGLSHDWFSVPPHTPVMLTKMDDPVKGLVRAPSVTGPPCPAPLNHHHQLLPDSAPPAVPARWWCQARFTAGSADSDPAVECLNELTPQWVTEALWNKDSPFGAKNDAPKLIFDLEPERCANPAEQLGVLLVSHLTCPSYLPIYKVAAHVRSGLKLDASVVRFFR